MNTLNMNFLLRRFDDTAARAVLCVEHHKQTRTSVSHAEAVFALGNAIGVYNVILQVTRADSATAQRAQELLLLYGELRFEHLQEEKS